MDKRKKRNINNLRIPPPINDKEENVSVPTVNVSSIEDKLGHLVMSDTERDQINEFLNIKKQISDLGADDLQTLDELGAGNGGVVTKVRHKPTGLIMARKMIHLEVKQSTVQQILREHKTLDVCNSPYIVGYFGAFYGDGEMSICMEYMDGGSLDLIMKKSGRIMEDKLAVISKGVLKGLDYLRRDKAIIHRDVKPSNILVNSLGQIKLCDFGVSGQLVDSKAYTFVGTRSYMSPERLQGTEYNILSDVWSFGLSLIEMALGRYPIPPPSEHELDELLAYDGPIETTTPGPQRRSSTLDNNPQGLSVFELLEYIVNEPPPTLPERGFSQSFAEFVNKCLKKNLGERATLQFLMDHDFIHQQTCSEEEFIRWIRKHISVDH